ncbi:type III-A CRISPR-associated protein Csm2 [bacterium]|nr:type III-A CRISPR-associated protein Csm2 [bacterium]
MSVLESLKNCKSLKEWNPTNFAGKDGDASTKMKEKKFREKFKMSQLRNFFGEVKKLEASDESEIKSGVAKLEMNLAYDTGRGVVPKEFYEMVTECTAKIKEKDDLKRFVEFLTALIAYHKFHSL